MDSLINPIYSSMNPNGIITKSFLRSKLLENTLSRALKKEIEHDELISILSTFNEIVNIEDFISLFRILSEKINFVDNSVSFILILDAVKIISDIVYNKYDRTASERFNEEVNSYITDIINNIDGTVKGKFLEDDNSSLKAYYSVTVVSLKKLSYKIKNALNDIKDIRIITPWEMQVKTGALQEASSDPCHDMCGGKIISDNSYSMINSFLSNDVNSKDFSPHDHFIPIYDASNEESLIVRLKSLIDCINSMKENNLLLDSDMDYYNEFSSVYNYIYDKLISNKSGLNKFKETLEIIINIIGNSENKLSILSKSYIDKIYNRLETASDELTVDELTEMGIGFVYEIIPDDVDSMSESAVISMMNALNEAFTPEVESQLINTLNETSVRREAKDQIKAQKIQNKYDLKHERERMKQERKNEKIRQKEIEKEGNKEYYKSKLKQAELTDPKVRKALKVIKGAIKGLCVGGVAAIAVGPAVGIITGALAMMSKTATNKLFPSNERRKIALELRTEIKTVENQIAMMERNGDEKNKMRLMRVKDKMEETYNRMCQTIHNDDLL